METFKCYSSKFGHAHSIKTFISYFFPRIVCSLTHLCQEEISVCVIWSTWEVTVLRITVYFIGSEAALKYLRIFYKSREDLPVLKWEDLGEIPSRQWPTDGLCFGEGATFFVIHVAFTPKIGSIAGRWNRYPIAWVMSM